MKSLNVKLADHSYPIFIEQDASELASLLSPYIKTNRIFVISNETVYPLFANQLSTAFKDYQLVSYTIADGEQHKTLETYAAIMTFLLENQAGRDATLIALGGGVVGDITGFVAATYMRGVDFIQIPTTLLSQVDSSVGGKTAVNHALGKNMIGAFYQPQAVMIDLNCLATLPKRELAAGLAEVVKYGVLGDKDFFEYLEQHHQEIMALDAKVMSYVIEHCCKMKADIVGQDEKEQGIRALLNLGHTFGHAIEAEQGYGKWLHGEAVAVGIVQAATLACHRGWLDEQDLNRIIELLKKFQLPTQGPSSMDYKSYLKHMKKDKKVQSETIRFILPKSLGQAILVSDVTEQELRKVLE